ncbi:MAG: hypothetical protein NZ522_03405, partial [Chitinophagales bacterium]|nr:hypothetical protein [Chitinophagales bacterium]
MRISLSKLKDIRSEHCVTILMNTHRTHPENKQDEIRLKNLIKEAEERLLQYEKKRDVSPIIKNLHQLEKEIDHQYNLESIVLFANEEIAEYVRLPISVQERIIIDKTFATRDLLRALRQETHYYVLLLSRQKIRLMEAFNDKVITENVKPFPIKNTQFYSTSGDKLSDVGLQSNLIGEFYNRADKELQEIVKRNPLPVLICSETSAYHDYLQITDNKKIFFDIHLNKNRVDDPAHAIASEAWHLVRDYIEEKNNQRKSELLTAVNQNKFLTDLNEIWQAVREGRIQTLFVEQNK